MSQHISQLSNEIPPRSYAEAAPLSNEISPYSCGDGASARVGQTSLAIIRENIDSKGSFSFHKEYLKNRAERLNPTRRAESPNPTLKIFCC